MEVFGYTASELGFITLTMLVAGFVKGVIAFAFPLVVVSLLANKIDPGAAVALGLIPGLAISAVQIRLGGLPGVVTRFWLFIAVMIAFVFVGASVAAMLSRPVLLVALGAMCVGAALLFTFNPRIHIPPHNERIASVPFGVVGGFFAGLSSVFGPPVVMYLVAIRLNPTDFVVAVSAIFTIVWLVVIAAFGAFGLMSVDDFMLSSLLIVPAMAGIKLGDRLRRRINQDIFRKLVLAALAISGLRLILTNFALALP